MKLCLHCYRMSHIKMEVKSLLFGAFLFFSGFTIKCFIYGIMLSHLKAFFYQTIKKNNLNSVCWNKTPSDAYFWVGDWMEIKNKPFHLTVFTIPFMLSVRMKNFPGILL